MRKSILTAILAIILLFSLLSACSFIQGIKEFATTMEKNMEIIEANKEFSDRMNTFFTTNSIDEKVSDAFAADNELYFDAQIEELLCHFAISMKDFADKPGAYVTVTQNNQQYDILVTKISDEEYKFSREGAGNQIDTRMKTKGKSSYITVDINDAFKYSLEKSYVTQKVYAIQYVEENENGTYIIVQIYLNGDNGSMCVYDNVEEIPPLIYGETLSSEFGTGGDRSYSVTDGEFSYNVVDNTFSDSNEKILEAKSNFSDSINQLFTLNSVDELVVQAFDDDINLYQQAEAEETLYYTILGNDDYNDTSGKDIAVTEIDDENYLLSYIEESNQNEIRLKTRKNGSYMSLNIEEAFTRRLEKIDLSTQTEVEDEQTTEENTIFAIQYVENNQMGGYTVLQIYLNGDDGAMAIYENVEQMPTSIYSNSLSSGFASGGDRNYAITDGDLSYNINE